MDVHAGVGKTFGGGNRVGLELGYVFGREFQFETDRPDVSIDDTLVLRGRVNF